MESVRINDPEGAFHRKRGLVIGRHTLVNEHFNWRREMLKVVFPPNDQKWIAFPKEKTERDA